MAGRESLEPSVFDEIVGAWEVLGAPEHFRYFVIREDLLTGWIPERAAIENASRAALSALIEARPLDQWRPANWLRFTFTGGEMTILDGNGRAMGYYLFRTATVPTSLEAVSGPVELEAGEILWAQTYRFPELGVASDPQFALSTQPLSEHRLRRLPD